ncbi:MAG: hypothetical protein GYB65_20845 [Chloroflexi bacterium]|nr:hypothetical protein [Chloroflexota bacterium]
MRNRLYRLVSLIIIGVIVLALTGLATAQEPDMTTPLELDDAPLELEFSIGAAGPPTIEPLSDGRVVFKINAEGPVTGALEGTMRSAITEVNPDPPVYQGIGITFTIETENGMLEGFYSGTIYHPTDAPIATVSGHGQILSVSGAYADLFLADVLVSSEVQFEDGRSTGESGTLTITPR